MTPPDTAPPDTGPPDINAGEWYLRARPDGGWDVCEPVSGEPRATITVSGDPAAAAAGAAAVRRYLLQLVAQPGQ